MKQLLNSTLFQFYFNFSYNFRLKILNNLTFISFSTAFSDFTERKSISATKSTRVPHRDIFVHRPGPKSIL